MKRRAAKRLVRARGHVFYKSSDCRACPRDAAVRKPAGGFLAARAAPARRALEGGGLTTLARLAKRREGEVLALHGVRPGTVNLLCGELPQAGTGFRS